MSNELLVRIGEYKDVDTLVESNMALAWETERKKLSSEVVTEGVHALLGNPQYGFYVVAELAGKVVGSVMVTFEWSDWRCGLIWWIQSVYVKPDFRRQGVFRSLYEFLREKASRERNVCGFRLYVLGSNRTGKDAYGGVGMKETSYGVYEELFEE